MAIYPIEHIKHLFDKNSSLLWFFEDDEVERARRDLSIGSQPIPPRINLDLTPLGSKVDTLCEILLKEFDKYEEEPYEDNTLTKISLKGIRNNPDRLDYQRMVGVIICNILISNGKSKYLRIPQGKDTIFENKYNRYNPSLLKISKVTNLIHFLALNDYIDFYINNQKTKFESRIEVKDKLFSLLKEFNLSANDVTLHTDTEVIILKKKIGRGNRGKTVFADYVDAKDTKHRREVLQRYNELFYDWKDRIDFKAPMVDIIYARCIYNDKIGRGGRVYALWQNISEENRGKIIIDGSSVVEIDLKSCSLRIACHLLGITVEKLDLYDIGDYPRKDVKFVVQQMLNMDSRDRSLKQCFNDMSNSIELQSQISNTDKEYIKKVANDIYNYYDTDEMKQLSSKFFFKDKGMSEIMPIESQLSFMIIEEFTNEAEVVLDIHDSFIVREELADQLINCIYSSYMKLLNKEPVLTEGDEIVDEACYF